MACTPCEAQRLAALAALAAGNVPRAAGLVVEGLGALLGITDPAQLSAYEANINSTPVPAPNMVCGDGAH